jgi:hypothetical protein
MARFVSVDDRSRRRGCGHAVNTYRFRRDDIRRGPALPPRHDNDNLALTCSMDPAPAFDTIFPAVGGPVASAEVGSVDFDLTADLADGELLGGERLYDLLRHDEPSSILNVRIAAELKRALRAIGEYGDGEVVADGQCPAGEDRS